MEKNFAVPATYKKVNINVLAKGFGLPLVKRALLNAQEIEQSDIPEYKTRFGTPVFDSLFIRKPNPEVYDFNEATGQYQKVLGISYAHNHTVHTNESEPIDGFLITNCIIEVSRVKNIVTTEISGMDGSVKEFINNGDYSITIRGIVDSELPNKAPDIDTRILTSYLNANSSLYIVSRMLNGIYGIDRIVATGFRTSQQEGIRNVNFFEINAVSDIDYIFAKTNV